MSGTDKPVAPPATRTRPIVSALAGFLIIATGLAVLLRLVPEIDLWVHGYFYQEGEGFFLRDSSFARFFYKGISWMTPVLVVGLIAMIGLGLTEAFRRWSKLRRPAIVLLACIAIGSGLVVNATLKDNWGRARPSQITEFGGKKTFTPPFVIADQCKRNCSFVAGHPSILFAFFGLAMFARRRRALAIWTVAVLGGLAGLGRMMQGAHFFSDVIYSGVFMFITAWLLYRLVEAAPLDGQPQPLKVPLILRRAGAEIWALVRQLFAVATTKPLAEAPPPVTARQLKTIGLIGLGVAVACVVGILWIDRPFALFLKAHVPILALAIKPFSELGEPTMWVGVSAIMGIALWMAMRRSSDPEHEAAYRRGWQQTLFLFLCTGVVSAVTPLVKILFGRARTRLLFNDDIYEFRFFEIDTGFWSFPSGHVATITAVAVALYLLWPRFARYYVAVLALVAFSRLVQTVHFPSDVIFSVYLATLICLMIKVRFERRGFDIFGREPGPLDRRIDHPRRPAAAE